MLREFEQHAINRSGINEDRQREANMDELLASLNSTNFKPSELENPIEVFSVNILRKIK